MLSFCISRFGGAEEILGVKEENPFVSASSYVVKVNQHDATQLYAGGFFLHPQYFFCTPK